MIDCRPAGIGMEDLVRAKRLERQECVNDQYRFRSEKCVSPRAGDHGDRREERAAVQTRGFHEKRFVVRAYLVRTVHMGSNDARNVILVPAPCPVENRDRAEGHVNITTVLKMTSMDSLRGECSDVLFVNSQFDSEVKSSAERDQTWCYKYHQG